jgi:hypothetical protein
MVIRKQGHSIDAQSDHRSFNLKGYKGIWWFEDVDNDSPYIHSPDDKIGPSVNNPDQVKVFTQAMVASIATLALIDDETPPPPIVPPTDCVAEYFDEMTILVSWNAPIENMPDEYFVYRDNTKIAQIAGLYYKDTVPDYEEYCYTVTAIYDVVESEPSNESCAFVPTPPLPLDPPSNCFAEYFEENFIKITWDSPTENTPDGYFVFRDETIITNEIWETTDYLDDVEDYEQHCYTVTAVYGEEQSEPSNESCDKVPVSIVEYKSNIKIYPNPTTGELRMEISDMRYETSDRRYEIYDVSGKRIEIPRFARNDVGADGVVINISYLPAGIYLIKISDEIVGKFVKK